METRTMTIRVPQELAAWLEKKEGSYNGAIVDALCTLQCTQKNGIILPTWIK